MKYWNASRQNLKPNECGFWNENSEYTLNEIIECIEIKFGLLVAQDYYSDVISVVNSISLKPQIFPIYQLKTGTIKAVINKKTVLYYKTIKNEIYLIAFYDKIKENHKL